MLIGILVTLSGCMQSSCPCVPSMDPSLYASHAKLKPKAQEALNKVLAKGLVNKYSYPPDDISVYVEEYSMETKYVIYVLTGNKCCVGDSNNILGLYIVPNLCRDLDDLFQQDTPSAETLDHAVWMASMLKLHNVISFLVNMGAPANKYKNAG